MRTAYLASLALALLVSGTAFAQMTDKARTGAVLSPQQIKSELEAAGFKNIAIMSSAYTAAQPRRTGRRSR